MDEKFRSSSLEVLSVPAEVSDKHIYYANGSYNYIINFRQVSDNKAAPAECNSDENIKYQFHAWIIDNGDDNPQIIESRFFARTEDDQLPVGVFKNKDKIGIVEQVLGYESTSFQIREIDANGKIKELLAVGFGGF